MNEKNFSKTFSWLRPLFSYGPIRVDDKKWNFLNQSSSPLEEDWQILEKDTNESGENFHFPDDVQIPFPMKSHQISCIRCCELYLVY